MRGQRKLIIQHFVNEEIKKLGKSPTGFPIQVRVRYKDVMTIFSSRLGIRYAKSEVLGEEKIRESKEISERIIQQELKYIIDVKNYFEETLEIEFNPKILVNEDIEVVFLKSVIEQFNRQFLKYDLLTILKPILGNSTDKILSSININIVEFILFIQSLNQDVYNKIIEKRNYKTIVLLYDELEKINIGIQLKEINLISFRLLEVNKDSDLGRFKETFSKWFDTQIIDLLKSDKNYSSFFNKW